MKLYKASGRFKALFFGVALVISVVLLLYTQKLVNDLRREARSILQFYAEMYASAASDANTGDVSFLFDAVIRRTYFPIIYTNNQHEPLFWKGIGIDEQDRSEASLKRVDEIKKRMARSCKPIPVEYNDAQHGQFILGYIYYGDSATITHLRWLPYIEIGLVGLFIFIGFIGFSTIKKSEQRLIWVGMSKETAHQLGTPISSLLGWVQILKERSYNRPETLKVIDEMNQDIVRLSKVAERFSQIGSLEDLQDHQIVPLLRNVVQYIRRRLPQMKKTIQIKEQFTDLPSIPLNKDLLEWVFENLIKNAIDAIDHDHGEILIQTGLSDRKKYKIYVDIADNGKGISYKNKNDVFRPGFSTKKRGWGLGLNLAKRIVEEYHKGKLLVKDSRPGVGTTMRVYL